MKRLCSESAIEGYNRLVELVKEQLGPQAVVTYENGMYWVQVFPITVKECLGCNDEHAVTLLANVIAYWHNYWEHLTRIISHQECYYDDENLL